MRTFVLAFSQRISRHAYAMSLKILLDLGRDAKLAFERKFIFYLIKGVNLNLTES
ncbi:MAG: hypothetical protein NVSMB6_00590 [Burkholderiaceae bacterium]